MNTSPVGVGFTSHPNAPDYIELNSKEQQQQLTNSKIQQGSTDKRGVILTKDSLDIPLELAFGINNDRAETSRPTLLPLFRTRFVADREAEELSQNYYAILRSRLPPELQLKLLEDERELFEDRDPDLIALDNSLKFDANVLTLTTQFGVPILEDDMRLIAAQNYLNLPHTVKEELLAYASGVTDYLDQHLAQIGPNDPSYELLLTASNELKNSLWLLDQPEEEAGHE